MSRSGAHEALRDHRLDLLIASMNAALVPMPECETAAMATDARSIADELDVEDEWLERTTLDGDL